VAERLKRGEEPLADRFEEVTVLFADLKGFTPLASTTPAPRLVEILNRLYREIDGLAAELGVEKIKTIGDAYMAAAGVPEATPGHAAAAASLGLAMLEAVARVNQELGLELQLRVGLHTGPAVAGVIGTHKFAYDLWGDAVNTASRMESHGVAGRVHLSEETRARLGDAFQVEERGEIEVKGKGPMRTYLLVAP
jgi:class 3 adenylate cyclase